MQLTPAFEDFDTIYQSGKPQVVYTSIVADLDTPVSAYLKLSNGEDYSFLLESVEGGETRGRYSIIGLSPDMIWRSEGKVSQINRNAAEDITSFEHHHTGNPLDALRAIQQESLIELPEGLPPMAAGLVGYMGYDMVQYMEKVPSSNPAAIDVPLSIFIRPQVMAIFDSVKNMITLVSPVRSSDLSSAVAYSTAEKNLSLMMQRLNGPLPTMDKTVEHYTPPIPTSNTSPERYKEMVLKAQEYILAGDVFQVVLSQRFTMAFELPPFALYRSLRRTNPSPFMYHLAFNDFAIVGSSPEILVRLRENEVTIRPIAGTRIRGATIAEDAELAADLLSDPKELSEHLMLLDLGRNDVGRVTKKGTVKVTARNTVEYYSHVMHIVSNVVGEIDPKFDCIDAIKAGFPAGTVSGAPKVRAMEIIDESETDARGPSAGSVGYFSSNGSMDTAIVLRTAIVKDGLMHVQAGAGIVADSTPESEQAECENKAKALIRAAEEAIGFATNRH